MLIEGLLILITLQLRPKRRFNHFCRGRNIVYIAFFAFAGIILGRRHSQAFVTITFPRLTLVCFAAWWINSLATQISYSRR